MGIELRKSDLSIRRAMGIKAMDAEERKNTVNAAVKAFRARLETECVPLAFKHTTPVFEEDEEKATNFGSGILARIDGHPFLLTAGHVYDDIEHSTKTIGIAQSGIRMPGLKLVFDAAAASEIPVGGRDKDMIDIAAYRLTDEISSLLGDRFVSEDRFEYEDKQNVGSQYFVIGFPASGRRREWDKVKGTARATAFQYLTSIYRFDRGTPDGYSQQIEIAVNYSKARNRSMEGNKVSAPNPHGMSGCGIWRVYEAGAGNTTGDWTVDQMCLVGIAHTWERELSIIRGTRIKHFVSHVRERILSPDP